MERREMQIEVENPSRSDLVGVPTRSDLLIGGVRCPIGQRGTNFGPYLMARMASRIEQLVNSK